LGGQAVAAGLIEARVSKQFGDDDKVVAFADETGSEGTPRSDVSGEAVELGDGQDAAGPDCGERLV
jgi:hypothetical protein